MDCLFIKCYATYYKSRDAGGVGEDSCQQDPLELHLISYYYINTVHVVLA
jgi:hypothetical protein